MNEEIVLKFVEEYENGNKKKLTFRFILDDTWKINDFSFKFLTKNGSFTGTLVSHEITNPTTGLTKKIYDKNTYLNLSQFKK